MDSAYNAAAIRKKAKKLKHEVPIQPVERPHCKKPPVWTGQQKQRFKIRTIVEQQITMSAKPIHEGCVAALLFSGSIFILLPF
jgi:hypothetical protein